MAVYSALFNEAKDFINDPILYKINMLMALFQKSPRGDDNGLSNLFCKYSIVIRRRLEWMKKNNKKSAEYAILGPLPYNFFCQS